MEEKKVFPKNDKPVGLCSDHAGYEMKEYIIGLLNEEGVEFRDYGTYTSESSDYPDFAHPLARAVENGECYMGIAFCGTGNGINMTLNKHQGVRSALCWMGEIAYYARLHNNANILTLPARIVANVEAKHIIEIFFNTQFEGGRHQRRIDKIPVE